VDVSNGFHWIETYHRTAKENITGEGAGMWSINLSDWIYDSAVRKARF